MKKSIVIFIAMILILTISACTQSLDINSLAPSEYGELKDSGIEMHIADEAVITETESIMIEYINNTDTEVTFGKEPHMEIESEGIWYVVPLKEDAAWEDIGFILPPNGGDIKEFSLQFYYENLIPGHYRIVKMFYTDSGNVSAAVEFDMQ